MDVGKAFYYNQEPKQLARSSFFMISKIQACSKPQFPECSQNCRKKHLFEWRETEINVLVFRQPKHYRIISVFH